MDARIGGDLGHHRDVGGVAKQLFQHDSRIVDFERESEALVALFEFRQDRNHMVGAVRADPQMPARQVAAAGEQGVRFFPDANRRVVMAKLARPASSARRVRGG